MSEPVVVTLINGLVSVVGFGLTYLGLRHRVDKQGAEVGERVERTAAKVDETRDVNLVQIATSNNFNQKLEKIHQGQQFLIRKSEGVDRRLESLDRDVKLLSTRTGIPLGND